MTWEMTLATYNTFNHPALIFLFCTILGLIFIGWADRVRDVEHAMDQLALGTKQLGINLRISSRDVKTIGDIPEKAGMKKVGWPQKYLTYFSESLFASKENFKA
jgi:hypothetical protein